MNTLEKIELTQSRLALYLKAEKAILAGQSYEAEGLKLTRANLADVQSMISKLEVKLANLIARPRKNYRVVKSGW